ncbi:uncharacterized protein [Periplaneta americana]|uniref:uncharacterized protein n=1 Tax=Periplaneta americana TaxID=6978 RepID=UPI0037E8AC41
MACSGCNMSLCECLEKKNDEEAMDFMIEHGVIKDSTLCGRCEGPLKLVRGSMRFQCGKYIRKGKKAPMKCCFTVSGKKGTFFGNCNLPMLTVFRFVSFLLHLKPPRHTLVKEELRMSDSSVVNWYSCCREVFIYSIQQDSEVIGGEGLTVEIHEAKFGKSKNSSHIIEGHWVLGGIERDTGKCFLVSVAQRDSATLLAVVKEKIRPGTTIISDCWKAYNCLQEEGYVNLTVNHTYNFVDSETCDISDKVEGTWQEVHSSRPKYGVRNGNFVGYLAEYLFKRKYPRQERIHHFFRAAASLYPPQY